MVTPAQLRLVSRPPWSLIALVAAVSAGGCGQEALGPLQARLTSEWGAQFQDKATGSESGADDGAVVEAGALQRDSARRRLRGVSGLLFANSGQMDSAARFAVTDRNVSVYFTGEGYTLAAGGAGGSGLAIRLQHRGGRQVEPEGDAKRAAKVNFYKGEARNWRAGLATYERIVYREAWAGIDLIYEPRPAGLEYGLLVRPGADLGAVRFEYQGVEDTQLDRDGGLVLLTAWGSLAQSAPRAWLGSGAAKREVPAEFSLSGDGSFGIEVPAYTGREPLLIDPTLSYGTLLGGGNGSNIYVDFEFGKAVALDSTGRVYVAGVTGSDFPTTVGAYDRLLGGYDVFVACLAPDGGSLVWSTFLGGSADDNGFDLAVDASDRVFVSGYTKSSDFPVTAGAYKTTFAGSDDAFVAQIEAGGGGLGWSTFLGGSDIDQGHAVAVDAAGNVFVGGDTGSGDFPTTAGAYDRTLIPPADKTFVTRVNAGGASLGWSTFLGGSNYSSLANLALDTSGNVYVTGVTNDSDFPTTPGAYDTSFGGAQDGFVTKIGAGGASLVWSTFLGGSAYDQMEALALDGAGNVFVGGYTMGSFPGNALGASAGSAEAFLMKFASPQAAQAPEWVKQISHPGGVVMDLISAAAVDKSGEVWATGSATPGISGQIAFGGVYDFFVARFSSAGAVSLTTYGTSGADQASGIAIDEHGGAVVVGDTSGDLDGKANAGSRDTFIKKL